MMLTEVSGQSGSGGKRRRNFPPSLINPQMDQINVNSIIWSMVDEFSFVNALQKPFAKTQLTA